MGTELQSTTVGSMRSTTYSAVRSTLISHPTLCFLMGAHDPCGLLGPTWMMLWRRLLTWHSLPLCSQNLAATAGMPISLYSIQDRSDPEWKVRIDEVGNVFQVHYHCGWAYMAEYAQHLFQLHYDTQHIVAEQQCQLVGYDKEVRGLTQEISRMA
jgi:hypothetical protein